jgi:hypothetical protein
LREVWPEKTAAPPPAAFSGDGVRRERTEREGREREMVFVLNEKSDEKNLYTLFLRAHPFLVLFINY